MILTNSPPSVHTKLKPNGKIFLSRKGAKHRKVLGNNEGDICVTPGFPKNLYKQE